MAAAAAGGGGEPATASDNAAASAAGGSGEAALSALRATLTTVKYNIVRESPGAWSPREPDPLTVEKILGKRGSGEYRVRWKGRDASEDSWEPAAQLSNASAAMAQYERRLQVAKAAAMEAVAAEVADTPGAAVGAASSATAPVGQKRRRDHAPPRSDPLFDELVHLIMVLSGADWDTAAKAFEVAGNVEGAVGDLERWDWRPDFPAGRNTKQHKTDSTCSEETKQAAPKKTQSAEEDELASYYDSFNF